MLRKPKRIAITVGGTGGHIHPGIAIAEKFLNEEQDHEILFIGGGLSKNRFFCQKSFPFLDVACSPFFKKNPFHLPKVFALIAKGIFQSRNYLKKFNPDLVVGFGSYYTFPVLCAAKSLKIPIVLHEANAIPGKVIKLFSGSSKVTGLHFPETAKHLKGISCPVGMPIKEEFLRAVTKQDARKFYQIDQDKITLLVFGGSQGAKALNQILPHALSLLHKPFQVLHFTGNDEDTKRLINYYQTNNVSAVVKTYEKQMNMAWNAADIIISRAGAGTISEMVLFEKPGILIPFPFAADNHQAINAALLEKRGAAIQIAERELNPLGFAQLILDFMANECAKVKQMEIALKHYKSTQSTKDFYTLLKEQL